MSEVDVWKEPCNHMAAMFSFLGPLMTPVDKDGNCLKCGQRICAPEQIRIYGKDYITG